MIVLRCKAGYCLPCTLAPSNGCSPFPKLLLASSLSVAMGYLHLPQLLIEVLFVRTVRVLEHHYGHLLQHIQCCFDHRLDDYFSSTVYL